MVRLDATGTPVVLEDGTVLQAPGLLGEARNGTLPGRLTEALERADLLPTQTVEIEAQEVPPPPGEDVRADDGRAGLAVEVPALGPGRGQVLLLADEQGVLTWHFPEPPAGGPGTTRGPGEVLRFTVPREVAAPATTGTDPADRSLVTAIGKKILSVLVYPIIDPLIGRAAREVAGAWERRSRPYRFRGFTPGHHRRTDVPVLASADWEQLTGGRALLFLHGIFSTSAGSFGGLDDATLERLHHAYGGRVLAFDHPTTSVDPEENALVFAESLPSGAALDLDIVCHSRGGLVARVIAGETGNPVSGVTVRRIVFVGTPNNGTPLADRRYLVDLINRWTSLLNLLPPGPWSVVTDVLDAVLEIVKVVGSGAAGGLPGLMAMYEDSELMRALKASGGAAPDYYAVHANFEPYGSLASMMWLPDTLIDRVFTGGANDVAVPSAGVGLLGGVPVPASRALELRAADHVWHCSYFAHPSTRTALVDWLAG
ncbi:esterase/lipase family protein [Geodermatophilus sp. SYSU D00758]